MVNNTSDRKHVRELEIARQVKSVFEELPAVALMNFIANLERNLLAAAIEAPGPEVPQPSIRQQWATKNRWGSLSSMADVQAVVPPVIDTESAAPSKDSQDRLDLVVPIPPLVILGRLVTSLVFEFKLRARDQDQLTRYSLQAANSLVISISGEGSVPPIERSTDDPAIFWLSQTWEHFYFAVQELLSDPRDRLLPALTAPADLLFAFDYRIAGQDRLTFTCERLLTVIQDQSLLPNRNLTLVVPIGGPASETIAHDPPYYAHPERWQAGYRYIAMISGNVLVAVYEVSQTALTERREGGAPEPPEGFPQDEWDRLCSDIPLRVALLQKLSDEKLPVGNKYAERSAGGRLKTFTFSHRYLEDLEDLTRFFRDLA
jgi:hypothetical protein